MKYSNWFFPTTLSCPNGSKQKNSYFKMWLIDQLYIKLGYKPALTLSSLYDAQTGRLASKLNKQMLCILQSLTICCVWTAILKVFYKMCLYIILIDYNFTQVLCLIKVHSLDLSPTLQWLSVEFDFLRTYCIHYCYERLNRIFFCIFNCSWVLNWKEKKELGIFIQSKRTG